MLLPGGVLSGALAPFVGALYDRVGPRALILPGSVIVAAAMWALSTLSATTPLGVVIGMHLLLSVGIALMFTPLMTTALGSLTPARYPHGSAAINTLQQVSGAAGIALFITLYTVASATASSTDAPTALAGGVSTAFAIGAIITVAAVPVAALLRKPATHAGLDEEE